MVSYTNQTTNLVNTGSVTTNQLILPAGAAPAAPGSGSELFSNGNNVPMAIDPSGAIRSLQRLPSIQGSDLPTVGTGQTASGMTVKLDANARYLVDLMAYWTTTGGSNVTTSWTGPGDASMVWGDTTTGNDLVTTLTGISPAWTTGNKIVRVYGFLTTVSSGSLNFTLASSVAASATLKAGSTLVLDRVA